MLNFSKIFIVTNFISLITFCLNSGDFDDLHSSITALEEVFRTEKLYIENTEIFLKYSSRILSSLKSELYQLKTEKPFDIENEPRLVNRLRLQNRLNDISKTNYIGFSKNISRFNGIHRFPANVDLEGVTRAINRLQEVYNYTAKEIASGSFLKVHHTLNKARLTSPECFLIGYNLINIGKKDEAEEWLNLAYDLYDRNQSKNVKFELKKQFHIAKILDFMAYTKFRFDDATHTEMAIELIKEAITEDPEYMHLYKQLRSYEEILSVYKTNITRINYIKESDNYKLGCQGRFKKPQGALKKLYCNYKYGRHPFLKLAPIKVEIHNMNPYLAVFHDVIYDKEIEILKLLSNNLLSRALVWDPKEAKSAHSHRRTSKFGWLFDEMHPFLNILNQRLEDMTDMSMETSEALQVMNYGIGGHYDIHADYLDEPNENNKIKPYTYYSWGNRIATVLFYMSDVEQGGATVYPHINIAVQPRKGTAAFWFNMLPSGKQDYKTRHAACPVVFGSKWVANKWIRYNGQIFKRQCTTNEDGYFS